MCRFDGYDFKIYQYDSDDPYSISGNNIKAIVEGNDGDLWIGTYMNGLNRFDPKTERFKHYPISRSTGHSSQDQISQLAVDGLGHIWIRADGVYSIDPQTEQLRNYYHSADENKSLSDGNPNHLHNSQDGQIWIVFTNNNIDLFNHNTQEFTHFTSSALSEVYSLSNKRVLDDGNGKLWLCDDKASMGYFDIKNWEFDYFNNNLLEDDNLKNGITCLVKEDENSIWIGTHRGLYHFNSKTKKYSKYLNDNKNQTSLSNNAVKSILIDTQGNLWVGTDQGVNMYDPMSRHFQFIGNNNKNPLFPKSWMRSLFVDQSDHLWLSTDSEGIFMVSTSQPDSIIHCNVDSQNLVAIAQGQDGYIWISRDGWIERYNPRLDKTTNRWGMMGNGSILLDKSGGLWNGFKRLNAETGQIETFVDVATQKHLVNTRILSVVEDLHGNIWFGTKSFGAYKLNPSTREITSYRRDTQNSNSITSDLVFSIHQDNKERIWLGTDYGLNLFDSETNEFQHYTTKDGLSSNTVYGILEDEKDNLWLSTNHGINKFDPETEEFTLYNTYAGVQGNEFNRLSYYKDKRTGKLYFGGINGVTIFHPDSINNNNFIPPVLITNFSISYQSVSIHDTTDRITPILSKSIAYTDKINLRYNESTFSFNFSALNYRQSGKNQYKYILEGYDSDWTYTDANNRRAEYRHVSPGKYVFRVKAANDDGIWNETGTSIVVLISRPWWMTWWAYTLYGLCIMAIGYGLAVWRIQLLKRKQIELQKMILQKTKQLALTNDELETSNDEFEMKNKEVQQVNRELSNTLQTVEDQKSSIISSINYAKRIQSAVLPPLASFEEHLPESFIMYEPKDIVAGDFYWLEVKHGKVLFAAADCTGHGVPGAMVSVICNNGLNRSVREHGLSVPGEILDKAREIVIQEFEKSLEEVQDGMDIALCSLKGSTLEYAGAYNPLWLVRNGELLETKANKQPIGKFRKADPFTTTTIELQKGDTFYIFSDGFQDQFGGLNDKKFSRRRFKELLMGIQGLEMSAQKRRLEKVFKEWIGNGQQLDDVCIIGIRI